MLLLKFIKFTWNNLSNSFILYFCAERHRTHQSCKSGRAFRVGFGFGPGSGLKLTKILGLIWAWDLIRVFGSQKFNQNNLATLLSFSDLIQLSGFFGLDLGFKLLFGFGPGSGLYYPVRAGFRPELVGPFTTLKHTKARKKELQKKHDVMVFSGKGCERTKCPYPERNGVVINYAASHNRTT